MSTSRPPNLKVLRIFTIFSLVFKSSVLRSKVFELTTQIISFLFAITGTHPSIRIGPKPIFTCDMSTPVFRSALELDTPPQSPGAKAVGDGAQRQHKRQDSDPTAAAAAARPARQRRRKSLTHPTANEHYHHFREAPTQCTCVLPAHMLKRCDVRDCLRSECAVERAKVEYVAAFNNPRILKCIPEDTVTDEQDQLRFGQEGRSCRFCSVDYWCWCNTCGNRLCAECTLREAEGTMGNGLGVRHKGVEISHIWC